MPTYKITKSLRTDEKGKSKIIWIGRLKKRVVARAISEKKLRELLDDRDKVLKKAKEDAAVKKTVKAKSLSKRLKAAADAFDETEEVVVEKKPPTKKPPSKKSPSKKSKKGFWK